MSVATHDVLLALRDLFATRFTIEELEDLAFVLGIDLENIPGSTRQAKARELAQYLNRRGLMGRLREVGPIVRSDLPWAEIFGDIPSPAAEPKFGVTLPDFTSQVDRKVLSIATQAIENVSSSRDEYYEGLSLLEKGWLRTSTGSDAMRIAIALEFVASNYRSIGQLLQALDLFQACERLWRISVDQLGRARVLNSIGRLYAELARHQEAITNLEASLSLYREFGRKLDEVEILGNLSAIYSQMADWARALAALDEAESLWIELADKTGLAKTSNDKGHVLLNLSRFADAKREFERALSLAGEEGFLDIQTEAISNLAQVATSTADWSSARSYYLRLLNLHEKSNDIDAITTILTNLGSACLNLGETETALEYYQRALAISRRRFDEARIVALLENIFTLQTKTGQFDEALTTSNEILALQRKLGDQAGVTRTQESVSLLVSKLDRQSRSLEFVASESHRFFTAAGFKMITTGELEGFLCVPTTSLWKKKFKGAIYSRIFLDGTLDSDLVMVLRGKAEDLESRLSPSTQVAAAGTLDESPLNGHSIDTVFALLDKPISLDAWFQINALRVHHFDVIPIPLSLLYESRATGQLGAERILLLKHLELFLGEGADPYDVRAPVSDVLNFFGRQALSDALQDRLLQGHAIGLFGLRKIGKSSLMRYMQLNMPCPTAWIDLQGGAEPASLFRRIVRAWINDAKARPNIDLSVKTGALETDDLAARFFEITQNLLEQMSYQSDHAEPRLAIFLDEIEQIKPPTDQAADALETYLEVMRLLRAMVQEDGRISILVAGVDPFVNRTNKWGNEQNPFYQLLQEEFVPPLLIDDCAQMIQHIGQLVEVSFTPEAVDQVVELSGGHPYLARQVCSLAYRAMGRHPGQVGVDHIQQAHEQMLFDPQYSTFLGETGLWGEARNTNLWGEDVASASQEILVALAHTDIPQSGEQLVAQASQAIAAKSALHALKRMSLVRLVNSHPDTYEIAFGLFQSWIRRVYLGLQI